MGSTNAMSDMSPYFTEIKVLTAKKFNALFGGKLGTQYGRGNIEFEVSIDTTLPYSEDDPNRMKKDGTFIPVKPAEIRFNLSFSVPDSDGVKEEDYFDGFISKDIARVVYTEVVPDDVIKDLGKFKKFFEEKLSKGIDAVINSIKDELEAPLKEQAIFAFNSTEQKRGEELQKVIQEVKSMTLDDVLAKKGILSNVPRMLFPVISINLESRISGNNSYKIEETATPVPEAKKEESKGPNTKKENIEKEKGGVKLEETPSKIQTELEEKEKKKALEESQAKNEQKEQTVKLEEAASLPQTNLEKTAIESERPKDEKKESPIPPPIESKTIIENNAEKTVEYNNTTREVPSLFQPTPFDATAQKETAATQEKKPEQQAISDNDIFTLKMYSLFEDALLQEPEAVKKAEEEKKQTPEKKAAKKTSTPTSQNVYEKVTESSDETETYTDNTSVQSNEVFNSQVLGQTVAQTLILSSINDSISSLSNNLESYIKVSEKTNSTQGGIFDSLKSVITSNESTKETNSVVQNAPSVVEMAGLISPERMQTLENAAPPKLETYEQKNSYAAIEKSISNTETNNISSTDITKLGENLNNSIKTVVTNPSVVNNNIKGPSVSSAPVTPPASPKPSDTSLMQDNSSMQNNMGSPGMPSTVSLSNTTVDSIANAIVKALTLTPFLNSGK